jgi:hypothetical protein
MAYSLSNLLQDIYRNLGQTFVSTATGGSTTTVVDSKLNERYSDDDFEDGGVVFVVRDAAGLSAAPEMEFSAITDYDQDTETFTFGALTAAVASGDTYMVVTPTFPLNEVIENCNMALKDLGDIALTDTSLTSASQQTEYALPVALKLRRPIRVQYQGITGDANDNNWIDIQFEYVPSAPNSTGLLIIPQIVAGRTIKVWYHALHPNLTAYNSYVSETIHPTLARFICTLRILEWYNRRSAGTDKYWVDEQRRMESKMDEMKVLYPVWKPKKKPVFFNVGADEMDYPPDPITY